MTRLSDAHHFRKMVAGMCMMFGPLVLLVGLVIHPESKTSEGAQLAVIADHLDQWYVAHLLILISIALAVPAVLGLMHMLRERQVVFGHVGGGLGLLGLLALTGLVTMDGFVGWQAAAGGNRAAMTSLFHSLHHTTGVVIPFFVVSFALSLGLICLAIGLYRAVVDGAVPGGRRGVLRDRESGRAELAGDRGRRVPVRRTGLRRPHGHGGVRRGLGAHTRVQGLPPHARDEVAPVAAADQVAARVRQHGRSLGSARVLFGWKCAVRMAWSRLQPSFQVTPAPPPGPRLKSTTSSLSPTW